VIQIYLDGNISQAVRDRGAVPKNHQQEMAYGESNDHVIETEDGGLVEVCTLGVVL